MGFISIVLAAALAAVFFVKFMYKWLEINLLILKIFTILYTER